MITHIKTIGELPQIIEWMKRQVTPAVSWNGPDGIRIMHRRELGREIPLISNPSKESASGQLALPAAGDIHLWNPETGDVASLGRQKGGAFVSLTLPGESARIVTLKQSRPRDSR